MKKIFALSILLIVLCTTQIAAQDFQSIEDLKRRFFERVLTITGDNDEVEGYVVYYMSEKQKKGVRTFAVKSFDTNLETIALTTLDVTKHTDILSTAFNGKNLCVILGDPRKKSLKAVTYNQKGEKQGELDWTLKKWYEANAEAYPSPTGFYLLRTLREKKTGFQLAHLSNSLKENWSKRFMPEKGYEGLLLATSVNDRLVFIKEKGPSILSKKLSVELVTMNEADGSIIGQFDLYDGKNTYMPSAIRLDNDGNVILGGMYFEGEKYRNINSSGVFVMKSGPKGKDKMMQSLPWKGEMQKYLAQSKTKGLRIDAKNKILFEDVILHKDGFQLIGETFSKSVVSLLQISDVVIGTNSGQEKPTLFNIKDILIFNFDNDLSFKNVQLIPKKEVNVSCYSPYNGMFGMKLAKELQKFGYFNYRFVMKDSPDDQAFTLISTNQGDLLDNIKKGTRYSITRVEPDNLEPKETLNDIALYDEKSRIRSYGLLRNSGDKVLVYYYDPKFDAVRLYLDDIK